MKRGGGEVGGGTSCRARRRRFSPRGEQRRKQGGEDGWKRRVDREREAHGGVWRDLKAGDRKQRENEMNEGTSGERKRMNDEEKEG